MSTASAHPFPTTLPEPRFPDPREAPTLRWGILAPGWIAGLFADTVLANTGQRIVAVASRSSERAAAFATTYGVEKAYDSYAQLVEDPDVDVVYVASPHSEHRDQALLAIAAGKHVLVEKAFTRNATEAREVVAAARAAGVFVMEAMWTRHLPHMDVIRQLLEDGVLGDVRRVLADTGMFPDVDASHRLLNPALAGGSLLDIGIYPLAFASFVARTAGLGERPTTVQATGILTPTGVDAQVSWQLGYADRAQAQLFSTLLAPVVGNAAIVGSAAWLELGPDFSMPGPVTFAAGEQRMTWDGNRIHGHAGLCFQAAALARYAAEGRTESPLQPLEETVAILETADEIRRQVGVTFPGE
jgi:predicted dehydrogenase